MGDSDLDSSDVSDQQKEGERNSDNEETCHVCNKGGNIICCESCVFS